MSANTHVVAGLEHAVRNRTGEALREFDRALQLEPTHLVARQARAAALMQLGDYDGAYAASLDVLAFRHGSRWWRVPSKAVFREASAVKLRHDIEQLRHLAESGLLPAGAEGLEGAFGAVLEEIGTSNRIVALTPAQHARIDEGYNCVIHLDEGAAIRPGALADRWDRGATVDSYARKRIAVIDGFLTRDALAALRRFCLDSTVWFDTSHAQGARGYIGADGMDGFACPLLFQIAEELRRALPNVLKDLPLVKLWAFKYDHRLQGIDAHADAAQVNVNFWITPDEANVDPSIGGMTVYDKPVPANWDFAAYNADPAALMRHVRASGGQAVQVPHRQNRAVVFDSALVHATQPIRFRPGYANRRINLTLLFGHRA